MHTDALLQLRGEITPQLLVDVVVQEIPPKQRPQVLVELVMIITCLMCERFKPPVRLVL